MKSTISAFEKDGKWYAKFEEEGKDAQIEPIKKEFGVQKCEFNGIMYKLNDDKTFTLYFVPEFIGKKKVERLVIPEGVTIIGSGSCYNCCFLSDVIMPSTLRKIEYWAFTNCSSLDCLNIPYGVTTDIYAFGGETRADVEFPEAIRSFKLIEHKNDSIIDEEII